MGSRFPTRRKAAERCISPASPPWIWSPANSSTGTFEQQFLKCFSNLDEALEAAGLTRDDVVKCTVFLTDMRDFPAMNKLYAQQFQAPYPARSCFSVTGLPMGAKVEVEMIAHRGEQ